MSDCKFIPVIRFMVASDIHLKDNPCPEEDRFRKALKDAYKIAKSSASYNKLDAVVIVGDFADKGSEIQMRKAKAILDEGINTSETEVILSVASHEYNSDGVPTAYRRLKEILGSEPDNHKVINGFHFISTSPSRGCNFDDQKIEWIKAQLKEATENEDPHKPVFVFQHPHNTGTVYGSILWGEDELISTYMNYPQIIDFSGHSHAPINDPRSIHQQHFTSLGTGTLSYFELDEFDKICGTVPENSRQAAQMLIVEADKNNRVRIYPYDVLTGNFFPYVWKIDKPWDPDSFTYTNARYKTQICPYFDKEASVKISENTDTSFKIEFDQAKIENDFYVNSYDITVRTSDGSIARQLSIWSEYYFYDMPKTRSCIIDGLKADTEYKVEVKANSFWLTSSKKALTAETRTK